MFRKLFDLNLGNFIFRNSRSGVPVMFFKHIAINQKKLDAFRESISDIRADEGLSSKVIAQFKKNIIETSDAQLIKDYYFTAMEVYKNNSNDDAYNLAELNDILVNYVIYKIENDSNVSKDDQNIIDILKAVKDYLSYGWGGNYGNFIRYLEMENIVIDR